MVDRRIVALLVFTALGVLAWSAVSWLARSLRTTSGVILVDTPEVYTRERLVNDRFSQDAWLRRQLDRLDAATLSTQLAISTTRSDERRVSSSVGASPLGPSENTTSPVTAENGTNDASSSDSAAGLPDLPLQNTADSPIDDFRLRAAYRDEIRSAIIENQLDDRHDIAGNTIYLLKFDVTLLPQDATTAWGIVKVRVEPPAKDPEEEKLLFDDWRHHYADQINENVRGLAMGIRYRSLIGGSDQLRELNDYLFSQIANPNDLRPPVRCRLATASPDPYDQFDILSGAYWERHRQAGKTQLSLEQWRERVIFDWMVRKVYFRDIQGSHWKDIAWLTHEHCDDGMCNFVVRPNVDAKDHVTWELAAFVERLERDREVYSYAVTPKDHAQRVQAFQAQQWARDLALGLSVKDGAASEATTLGKLLQHSEQLAGASIRKPLIVGIGEGRREQAGRESSVFGWLIGPRIGLDEENRILFRHVPSQSSVSAIVSVPSWWRRVSLKVTTCWVPERGVPSWLEGFRQRWNGGSFAELADYHGCGNRRTAETYEVALPGSIAEITRKLGFDVIQRPYVRPVPDPPRAVVAGEPAEILIRGGHLWRSTVVTLGAQAADQVEVLPNMQGIIARFCEVRGYGDGDSRPDDRPPPVDRRNRLPEDCPTPSQSPTRAPTPAPASSTLPPSPPKLLTLRVWTSEGVAWAEQFTLMQRGPTVRRLAPLKDCPVVPAQTASGPTSPPAPPGPEDRPPAPPEPQLSH